MTCVISCHVPQKCYKSRNNYGFLTNKTGSFKEIQLKKVSENGYTGSADECADSLLS